jgi:hypothetical protein
MAIDDRILSHLQIVIVAKLRRGESFAFTWQREPEDSGSQHVVWIHPAIFLEFVFTEDGRPPLNRAWIDALMAKANSTTGLALVPEPDAAAGHATPGLG